MLSILLNPIAIYLFISWLLPIHLKEKDLMAPVFRNLFYLLLAWVIFYLFSRFLPLKKYGIQVNPLYLLYKTQRLNDFLKKAAHKNPRFWKIVSNLGIAFAVGEIIFAFYVLGNNLFNFIFYPEGAQAVFPILPGITISLEWFPYILLAAGLAITVHEFSHGIVAYLEGIPIKSSGIIIAPITFGGFVEPDEDIFNKSSIVAKLRLLAAGSLANLVVGILVTLIATSLFIPNSGVLITSVDSEGPAYRAGMRSWEVIYEINGTKIENVIDLTIYMNNVKPQDFLAIITSKGVRELKTDASPENASRAIIGVYQPISYFSMRVGETSPWFTYHINLTLFWISLVMTNLAIFNMLPLYPLDGEAYLYSLLKEKVNKNLKIFRIALNGVSLSLLTLNIALTFLKYGLTPL